MQFRNEFHRSYTHTHIQTHSDTHKEALIPKAKHLCAASCFSPAPVRPAFLPAAAHSLPSHFLYVSLFITFFVTVRFKSATFTSRFATSFSHNPKVPGRGTEISHTVRWRRRVCVFNRFFIAIVRKLQYRPIRLLITNYYEKGVWVNYLRKTHGGRIRSQHAPGV